MTDKEMQKIKDSLPEWDKQNEEEQKLNEELDCRDMINSILIYDDLNKTIDEIYENKYLRNHKEVLSEERIKELIKEQQDDLKKSKINSNIYTDGEGVTYSSVTWYDEDNDKQEESKSLNESLGSRYEVWERYFEDGGVPDPKGELAATFDTYAEAVKYMDGLMKDPDCEAWIVDTMQEESKELEQGLIFDTITDLANYIAKHYEEITNIPLKDIFNNSEDEPIFNQDVIDKGWDKIKAFIDLYGSNFKRDDLLDEIDDALINERHDQSLYESKELRKYNSRLYGVYDTEKEKYEEVGSLEDMKEKVESEKEDVEEKQEEPKEDKKDININITVKNENKEEYTQDYKDLYRELDELIKANATDKELNDFLENASFNEVITNNEYLALQKKAQNARMIDLKKGSLDDKNIILSRVFAQYPDIDDEDEDYLNGLSLEELIIELRSRGWEDLMEENEEIKKVKTESLEEESVNPIINPEDKFYKDEHLYEVLLYPGAGVELIPYYVYANYEQDALEILLPYLLENAPGLVYDISDLEEDDLDDYITVDGIHYLNYNTRIEELEGEDKEKIETEFFKNYKEEE